jgi:Na+-driven multidrug efflux pump
MKATSPSERRQMMLAGPIVPTVLMLAAPNALSVAMQSLVSVADAWFVGQLGIGARQYVRAKRLAWAGALMAAAIAASVGFTVALWPDLWLGLFTADPRALAYGRTYLSIVGPFYGFFGLAMALYFASQGTGEVVWPLAANLSRISVVVGGSLLALDVLGWGLQGLFGFVALGIVLFATVLAFSTTGPAWRGTI